MDTLVPFILTSRTDQSLISLIVIPLRWVVALLDLYAVNGQLPTGERNSLIERPRLLFKQRQVMQWIEDKGLTFIAALMPGMTSAAGD